MSLRNTAKKFIPKALFKKIEPYGHWIEAVIAQILAGFPARGMKFVGVTGTNGKTSTTLMIANILRVAGYKVGVSSTAIINDGKTEFENNLDGGLTNVGPFTMQKLLKSMKKNGVEWVVVEAGSQGLRQHRLLGIKFSAAIITNLTSDHLDYHGNMKNYAAAKAKLFEQTEGGVLVTNADDKWAYYFSNAGKGTRLNYGKKAKDFRLLSIKTDSKYNVVTFSYNGKNEQLKLRLQGDFNAYNALAATAVTVGLGIDFEEIKSALESIIRIPGRMDEIDEGQDFRLIVDYAHTPDAIKNILLASKSMTSGKLICVAGASGDRSIERRAPVAKIACELADVYIITDDEPATEDPVQIRKDIKVGIITGAGKAEVIEIPDRTDAIKKAISIAKKGDTVVIAGIGHQKYRGGPDGKEKWDEYEVTRSAIHRTDDPFTDSWRGIMHKYYPDSY